MQHSSDTASVRRPAGGSVSSDPRWYWRRARGREHLRPEDVAFVGLYVNEDLEAAAAEKLLIRRYRTEARTGESWNFNSFGNHDVGK